MLRRPRRCQGLADEGRRPGREGRGLDLEIHRLAAKCRRHTRRRLGELHFDALPQRIGRSRVAEQLAQALQVVPHVGMAARVHHHHRDAQCLQPLDRAGRWCGQHQVGPQRDDAFDLRIVQPAQLGQCRHLRRPVGIAVGADQPRAAAQRAQALGERRHQADDALRRCVELPQHTTVVLHGRLRRGGTRQAQQRAQTRERARPGAELGAAPCLHSPLPSKRRPSQNRRALPW